MSKFTKQEWRDRAAKFLRVWRKTESAKHACKELGVSKAIFHRTLRHSKVFQKRKERNNTDGYTTNEYYWALRYAKKIKGVRLLGGRCIECGETNIFKLDFHHPDDNKETEIGDIRMNSWDIIKTEVVKCQLLCRNCHQVKHVSTEYYEKTKGLIEWLIKRMGE